MTTACMMPSDVEGLARDVLASTDCLITDQVQRGYAMMLAPGSGFQQLLTAALIIYVAFVGYRLMLGYSSLTMRDAVIHFVKIGVVLALVTSWPSYEVIVFNLLFNGPEQIAGTMLASAPGIPQTNGDIFDALQAVFDRITTVASAAWGHAVPTPGSATVPLADPMGGAADIRTPKGVLPPISLGQLGSQQFLAMALWASALLMLLSTVGVLLVVRILLALLLLVGPLFIVAALFAATQGLFEGWLRTAVKFALAPLFTILTSAALLMALTPFVIELEANTDARLETTPVLAILLITIVFAAVLFQAAKIAGGIASGIRLPKSVSMPMSVSPRAGRTTVSAVRRAQPGSVIQAPRRVDVATFGGASVIEGAAPITLVATRRIVSDGASARATSSSGDNSQRLGQSYRRLALAAPAYAGAPRSRLN